jgi:hypothetical protein
LVVPLIPTPIIPSGSVTDEQPSREVDEDD